jgi:hypothetical protein
LNYLPPDTGVEVPDEFVNVTDTPPIAEVSPSKVKGTVSENPPPLVTPALLANQPAVSGPNGTVQFGEQPLSCDPVVAVKTNAALTRSLGVELASRDTWKPAGSKVSLTEPGTMIGGRRGTVMRMFGGSPGKGTTSESPDMVKGPSVPIMSPATLPNCRGGIAGLGVDEFAGIVTGNEMPPVANRAPI